MSSDQDTLDDLRQEIDSIDDALHDLLMRRAEVVERIGATKTSSALRPGREAQMLRRLVARHRGSFPKAGLVRVWREIVSASVTLQGPFTVAVYAPTGGADYMTVARDHFGSVAKMTAFHGVGDVIAAVTQDGATVGVLPLPTVEDSEPWWRNLIVGAERRPRIISKLPFTGRAAGGADVQAFAVARTEVEPTAADRTLFSLEADEEVSRATVSAALQAQGLTPVFVGVYATPDRVWQVLVEIDDYLAEDDPRLGALVSGSRLPVQRSHYLGGYPVPFEAAELA